jgi:alpha-tubulin suppressor-like RCC1 family protein
MGTGTGAGGGADHLPVCGPEQGQPCARVTDIHAGHSFSCAQLDDGTLRCWGTNSAGELGAGYTSPFEGPVVGITQAFDQVELGSRHGCGRRGQELYCWGRNTVGQLGVEGIDHATEPQLVPLSGVTDFEAHRETTCAITTEGRLYCWGFTFDGQKESGFDGGNFSSTPSLIPGLETETVLQVGMGEANGCALLPNDEVRCWGYNQAGRLGTGDTVTSATAVPALKNWDSPVHRLVIGDQHGCVLAGQPEQMWCWGFIAQFHYHYPPTFLDEWIVDTAPMQDVRSAWRDVCALTADGVMRCLGDAAYGKIAGGSQPQSTMIAPPGLGETEKMAVGTWHSCGLRTDGDVMCWGMNLHGQLGLGFLSQQELPTIVDFNGGNP